MSYGSKVAVESRFTYRTSAVERLVLDTADFRRSPRPEREIDADSYAQVTVRLQDSVACSSVECRVTKYRLLSEGDMNFFAGFLRFHPEQTVCEVNVEKSVHEQFVRYLRDMDVVGGGKLEGVAEMFNLYELQHVDRPRGPAGSLFGSKGSRWPLPGMW